MNTEQIKFPMTMKEFSQYCVGCGGDWTATMLSGLKTVCRPLYDYIPNKEYSFDEVCDILVRAGILTLEQKD